MKRKTHPTKTFKTPAKKTKIYQNPVMIPSKSLVFQRNTVSAGPERKNIDLDLTLVSGIAVPIGSMAWSPTITLLNPVAQGATEITRVGRKYQMTKISMNWTAQLGAASTGGCSLRFRVVYDKQTNGAAPTILQVFALDNFHSANNLANSDRFITLIDEITPPIDADNNQQVSGRITKTIGLETMCSGTTGAVTSISSGSVYLFVSQSGGALASSPTLMAYVRTRFIDI